MEFNDFKENIKNPFTKDKLKYIFEKYGSGNKEFYAILNKNSNRKVVPKGISELDNFLYENWKNTFLNTDLSIFDNKKLAETRNLMLEHPEEPQLHTMLSEKVKRLSHGWMPTEREWTYLTSDKMFFKPDMRIHRQNIKHRLYVNCHLDDLCEFVTLITQKLTDSNKNFSFKAFLSNKRSERRDKIVFYADTEEVLLNYINVLEEIEQEHPEIISKCKTPPLAAATYKDWIGYGIENENHDFSYTHFIQDSLEQTLTTLGKELKEDSNTNLTGNETDEEISTFIATHMDTLYPKVYSTLRNHIHDNFGYDFFFIGETPPSSDEFSLKTTNNILIKEDTEPAL